MVHKNSFLYEELKRLAKEHNTIYPCLPGFGSYMSKTKFMKMYDKYKDRLAESQKDELQSYARTYPLTIN